MEEIKARLKETAELCEKAYEAWVGDHKNGKIREALQESVHELRKVASRLEIEIAMSERDQMAGKRIPIPQHRSSQKAVQNSDAAHVPPMKSDEGPTNAEVKKVMRRSRKPKPQE